MRLTEAKFDVKTRFGGRFVDEIDGLKGAGASGMRDWFFFVNGVEAGVGAAEYELMPGDRVQWDYRDWDAAMRVPAIVGAFSGALPQRMGGEAPAGARGVRRRRSEPCKAAKDALERVDVPVSGSSLVRPGPSR